MTKYILEGIFFLAILFCCSCANSVDQPQVVRGSSFIYDKDAAPITASIFVYDASAPALRANAFITAGSNDAAK